MKYYTDNDRLKVSPTRQSSRPLLSDFALFGIDASKLIHVEVEVMNPEVDGKWNRFDAPFKNLHLHFRGTHFKGRGSGGRVEGEVGWSKRGERFIRTGNSYSFEKPDENQ